MERASLNSEVLQKNFPEVYKEFFGKCDVVLSTSLSFSWIDDFAKRYRGISIKQKMPFKTYIGIEITNESTFDFGNMYQYEPLRHDFEVNSLEREIYPIPEVRDYINGKLGKFSRKTIQGGKIHCLTELPPAHGYGFFGNVSALIASLIYMISGRLTEEELGQWKNFAPMELLKNEDFFFSDIFYAAWDIDYILKMGDSNGAGPLSSLIDSTYPIVTFPAKTVRSRNYLHNKQNHYARIGKVPFWGFRLNDLYQDLTSSPLWPIDMGVVFSGKPFISERISQKLDHDFNLYEDFKSHFREMFKNEVENGILFPDFYENCILIDQKIVNKFYDLYGVLSMIIIRQLHQLLLHGYNEAEIEKFIGTMNKRHFASLMMDESSSYMGEYLLKLNTKLLQGKAFSNIGFFNTNNIMLGGGVAFVTHPQLNRMNLLSVFEEMKKDFSNMSVDYISWLDGYADKGVKVEQYLSKKNYSAFIDGSSIMLSSFTRDKDYQAITTHQVIEGLSHDYDLLCNMIDNSIIIGGREVSSTELHSKKATLTVLAKLLERRNEEVSCHDLPRSSYSMNKNEMQGKIVLPLLKLIRDRTQKNLGLTCKGGNTSFYLKLSLADDQKIGIINNIK